MPRLGNKPGLPFVMALAVIASSLVVGETLAADALIAPKTLHELVAGAKKEKTLRGMWSSRSLGGSKGFAQIVAAMNKKYGTNVEPQFTPGPSKTNMIGRLTRELKAGQPASTDVVWANSPAMLQSAKVSLMRPMNWMAYLERPMLKEEGFNPITPGGTALASASPLVGVVYNSDMVRGDDIPKTLADTLNPKWKGKIASTAYAAGMREFAMPDLLGKEAMVEFTAKLSKQIGGLIRCGTMNRITSREFAMLVLSCGDQYANRGIRRGEPLGYSVMRDAVVSNTRYGAVPVHSRAPNAAALFIVYLHSPEGQKWLWEVNGSDFHLYPESHERKLLEAARAEGARVAINSPQWLANAKDYRATRKELEKILQEASLVR